MHEQENKTAAAPTGRIILLDPSNTRKAATQPDKRDIGDYEQAFNN